MKAKSPPATRSFFLLLLTGVNLLHAQGTAFTYQGRLDDGASPATGIYDVRFAVYNAASLGAQQGSTVTNAATAVSNGLFTVTLDFGAGIFAGDDRWLEIGVRTNGGGAFTTLAPRQPLTPTPYAIFAGGADAAGLTGTIPAANLGGLYGNAVNFNNGANSFNGSFFGQFFGSSFIGGNFVGNFVGSGSSLSDVWHTTGNFGTIPGLNFIGTTDFQPLIFKVWGQQAMRYEPTFDTPNVVGGWSGNSVQSGLHGVTIGGGGSITPFNSKPQPNVATNNAYYATIAGGYNNTVKGYGGVVAGGSVNTDVSDFGVIGGGQFHTIDANSGYAVIGGGIANSVRSNAYASVIGGGQNNVSGNGWAVIAGGYYNTNNGLVAFIGAGDFNSVGGGGGYAVLGGGYQNLNNGFLSVLGGGYLNLVNSGYGFLGGGQNNQIQTNSDYSFTGGGYQNRILTNAANSVIGGGLFNTIHGNADQSVIAGGNANQIQFAARESFVGGGFANVIQSNALISVIGGGANNNIGVGSYASTIGGGQGNNIQSNSYYSTIAGGGALTIGTNANSATIGGGYLNGIGAGADRATVAGGNGNFILEGSGGAFIGGGVGNTIGSNSAVSTIAGGNYNFVLDNNWQAAIGGGLFNTNGGYAATVPGGYQNFAGATYAFAAGQRAKALHGGSFVWADSQAADFLSTATDQFNVRAGGGVRFETAGAGMTLDGQPVLTGPGGGGSLINADLLDGLDSTAFSLAGHTHFGASWSGSVATTGLAVNNSSTTGTAISGVASAGSGATVGVAGTANSLNGVGVAATGSSSAGTALQISKGGISVPGAGIGTSTPAFVHRATGANIEAGAFHRTTITHPQCDGDPNAILIITHNYNPSNTGSVLDVNPTSVFYHTGLSKWQIYHDNFVAMTTNSAWNVLILKP